MVSFYYLWILYALHLYYRVCVCACVRSVRACYSGNALVISFFIHFSIYFIAFDGISNDNQCEAITTTTTKATWKK